jgi:hypothetical protein
VVIDAHLDAVTKARSAYVLARTTLEARLREQMREELNNLQTQIDIAVRYAYDAGASKASILRAMGIKDFGTLQASLSRTNGVIQPEGEDPLDAVYGYDRHTETLVAKYQSHGPQAITGEASFQVKKMDDGSVWFMSRDPLWNADFTQKNDVVAALDNRQYGHYYEEALDWWKRSS